MSQVFIVIVTKNEREVFSRLCKNIESPKSNIFKIDEDKFAVAFDGTSRDLVEKAGIRSDPSIGSGIAFPITTYSGRADPALWEWLGLKMDH